MAERPLQYDSLKAILQYMDPNVRIQIASRIPPLREVENSIPLRIKELSFDHMKTIINGVTYQVAITRQYPANVQNPIDNGKEFSYDVDQYGFDITSTDVTPGDVDLRTDKDMWTFIKMWRLRGLRQRRDGVEMAMKQRHSELEKRLADVVAELSSERLFHQKIPALRVEKKNLTKRINRLSSNLLKFDLRRNKIHPIFTHFLQLTIGSYQERMQYSNKLCQAMKYLNTQLFGGRRLILVDELAKWDTGYVIHLPVGFKIRVRELELIYNELNELQAILDDSELQKVTTHVITNLNHPIIQRYDSLVIKEVIRNEEKWLPMMTSIKNRKVRFTRGMSVFSHDDCIQLVNHWRDSGRSFGTRFSFAVREERVAKIFMKKARAQFEVVGETDGSLTLSMTPTTVLHVTHERAPPGSELSFWFLTLEIKQRGLNNY